MSIWYLTGLSDLHAAFLTLDKLRQVSVATHVNAALGAPSHGEDG